MTDRVIIREPGKPWDGISGTVVERCPRSPDIKVRLDRIPLNWPHREAWFVEGQYEAEKR